jgi:hypothetical protein
MSGNGNRNRNRSRGNGKSGGRGKPNSSDNNSSKTKSSGGAKAPVKRKELKDYIFNVGTPGKASDYAIISQFIINHCNKTFSPDVGGALKNSKPATFDYIPSCLILLRPVLSQRLRQSLTIKTSRNNRT